MIRLALKDSGGSARGQMPAQALAHDLMIMEPRAFLWSAAG